MRTSAAGGEAWGPALERYRSRIERHVRSVVHDRSEAEDLTQETLLKAHEQLGALRDPGALGVWLYRIATRVCYDHLRKARLARATPRALPRSPAARVSDVP